METKPLQRIPPCPGAPEENLSWAPWKKSEGVKIDPMNILFLLQQGHLLLAQPERHSWMSVKNILIDQDPD